MKIKSLKIGDEWSSEKLEYIFRGRIEFEEEDLGSVDLILTKEETNSLLALSLPIFERVFGEKVKVIKQEIEKQIKE